jgi:SAM-dependent methyltransferase
VLELGCGNGKTLSAMLQYPWTITALDVSVGAVMLGRIAAPERVDFLVADACLLPFCDLAFDAVFAFHVVGHVLHADREAMASEVTRVLKHEGKLFFRDFSVEDMRAGMGEEVEPGTFRRGQGVTTHYFTEAEAADLFSLMKPVDILTHKWKLRVRGKDLLRAEIEAVFQKIL